MASRSREGKYGITRPRVDNILGEVLISDGRFANTKGEIISHRNDHMQYLTVQVPAEYEGRVYVLNLLYNQCKDIQWRYKQYDF